MEILQELKETIADIRNWDGAAMKAWDQSHRLIKEGNKSDLPRLIYENTISGYMETMIKSADEIERLRGALRTIDNLVPKTKEIIDFPYWVAIVGDIAESALNGTWPAYGVMPESAKELDNEQT